MIDNIRWWAGRVIMSPFFVATSILIVCVAALLILFASDVRKLHCEAVEMLADTWRLWWDR
jgi:hypothetical protein